GTLLIDHFVQHWTSSADETAPDIRLLETLEDGDTVTHRVSVTDGGRGISSSRVSVSADGSLHPFSYNETTGILQVTLPAAPLSALSVVSVTAGDSFGNYSRFQIKRDGEAVPRADAAADLDTSWGARTLRYLDDMGLLICAELEGVRYFEPGRVTTRLEIFEMLMLFKGVDTSLYADTVLPFSDLEGLSESQLATAKAAYALGYVSGELQPDGRLLLNANGSLTRATFCVIASAAAPQGLGFVPAQFTDNADIPGYAFNAMSRFAANGLISGIGGGIAAPQQTITRDQVAQILLNLLL
ncbi:MAG: S-layer homology domain-containing protein, partial [Oscillospiraceae bacterium]|nr:S-layer homology domain-containing protein [Oscillospiraceae bacterium]